MNRDISVVRSGSRPVHPTGSSAVEICDELSQGERILVSEWRNRLWDNVEYWLKEIGESVATVVGETRGRDTGTRNAVVLRCSRDEASFEIEFFEFDILDQCRQHAPLSITLRLDGPDDLHWAPPLVLAKLASATAPDRARPIGSPHYAELAAGWNDRK